MTLGQGRGVKFLIDIHKNQIIFVGLDVVPFEEAREEDMRNTVVISAVLLILGFGGLLSLYLADRYRATTRILQDTSAFADEVVAHLPVGLIATDREGDITFFNESAERITGLGAAQAAGQKPNTLLPTQLCGLKSVMEGGKAITEKQMECTFSSGRTVPLSVSATRIINAVGELVGYIFILRDLGEVQQLQDEIRRQEKLAAIRTDLDSFSDVEAYALMVSGYRMVESEFDRQFSNFPKYTGARSDWPFLQLEDAVSQPAKSQGLMKLLDASRKRAFKIWYLSWPLKICGVVLGMAALAFFFWACLKWPSLPLLTLGAIGIAIAVLIASAVVGKTVVRIVRFRETLSQIGIGIAMSLLGWIFARIHLHVFDRLFLHKGRL